VSTGFTSLGLLAVGPANGMNVMFTTPTPYDPGSLEVFLNGQAKRADFADGWVELGGGLFQMKIAPETGDVVQVAYRPI